MNMSYKVVDVMTKKLITLHPKDKVQRAKKIFKDCDIHHIPVVVMNKVVGIISQGDILLLEGLIENSFDRFIQDKKLKLDTVDQVMTPDPICADIGSTTKEVLHIMLKCRINAVPIVEGDDIRGLVTSRDLLHILYENLEPDEKQLSR